MSLRGIQWPQVTDKKGKTSRSSTSTATKIIAAALKAAGTEEANDLAQKLEKLNAKEWRFGYQKYLMKVTQIMGTANTDLIVKMAEAGITVAQNLFEHHDEKGTAIPVSQCTSMPCDKF